MNYLFVILLQLQTSHAVYFENKNREPHNSNEWIVSISNMNQLKSKVKDSEIQRLSQLPRSWVETLQNTKNQSLLSPTYKAPAELEKIGLLRTSKENILSLIKAGIITDAEPNIKIPLLSANDKRRPITNDTYITKQWGLYQSGFMQTWTMAKWRGINNKVLIFIIDTWIDTLHEDLNSQSFWNPEPRPEGYTEYHGTHVAGIISSKTMNAKGIAGSLWDADIIPIGVCDYRGCDLSRIIQALYLSADAFPELNGDGSLQQRIPRVVNMSLGGNYFSMQMKRAVEYATNKDVLVVAAAGNSANAALSTYPASYPDVVSVGAVGMYDKKIDIAPFSNYGARSLTILAPGADIISTVPRESHIPDNPYTPQLINNEPYAYLSGTSMAAPMVTAAAALLRAQNPRLPQYAIRELLVKQSDDIQISRYNETRPYKLLNVSKAYFNAANTPLITQRPQNESMDRSEVQNSDTCYVRYSESAPCSDCIKVKINVSPDIVGGNGKTRIRWMVFQDFMAMNPFPIWTSEVTPGESHSEYLLYYFPEDEDFASGLFSNQHSLTGFIEDRDRNGEIRDLIPIRFSDGSDAFDLKRNRCAN